MTTREENELITRTGPGTPGGEMMRRYWHPVALSSELPQGAPPLPLRVMSEDVVLFRDEHGKLGMLQRRCPHRCTDLSYGRIEDGGLRCLYHGWLWDVNGNCLEMPAEPENTPYRDKVKARSYPVKEIAGMIFGFFGTGDVPELPDYEFFHVPEDHCWLWRADLDCNWMQGLEANIDPAHLSYLHRPLVKVDTRPVPGSDKPADAYYAQERRPKLDVEQTPFGVRIFSIRNSGADAQYVRVTNFVMPNSAAIVGNEGRVGEGYSMHFHVPIDDTHHTRYDFVFNRVRKLDKKNYSTRFGNIYGPDGVTPRTLANRYLQDREAQKTVNFTGMGPSFNIHDAYAVETMGPITARENENLATTDIAIVRARRQVLEAIQDVQEGKVPRGVATDEASRDRSELVVMSEVLPKSVDYKQAWRTKVIRAQAAE